MTTKRLNLTAVLIAIACVSPAGAGTFDLSWYTIDGGGGYSSGSEFELEGTIGQPDAGYLAGGDFELEGGFWTAAIPTCACLGDMNGDGKRDGADIQSFVLCLLDGGSCQCADVDGMNGVDFDDTTAFVANLLSATGCP